MEKKHDFEGRLKPLAEHFLQCYEKGELVNIILVEEHIRQELIAVLERAKEGKIIDGEDMEIVLVEDIDRQIAELKS